jgi:hypothetical protein
VELSGSVLSTAAGPVTDMSSSYTLARFARGRHLLP